MNPMDDYCTDGYPRAGCTASVDVTAYGYGLQIFAPNGAPIETYMCVKTPRAVGRMLTEWCLGKKPRLYDPSDAGSNVT